MSCDANVKGGRKGGKTNRKGGKVERGGGGRGAKGGGGGRGGEDGSARHAGWIGVPDRSNIRTSRHYEEPLLSAQ